MPGGVGREGVWDACVRGTSGIKEIRAFDSSSFEIGVAGELADEDFVGSITEGRIDKVDRFAAMAMAASREALSDSGLDPEVMGEETGVYMGSGYSGRKSIDRENEKMYRGGARRVHPRLMQNNITNAASGEVAIELGLKGANLAYSVGYSSGSYALIQAYNALKLSPMRAILAGGAEAPVLPLVLEEMMSMGEMSRRREYPGSISSPFDKTRDGFVASEGACVLVLENLDSAKSRGARIYAEITGYGLYYDKGRNDEGGMRSEGMSLTMAHALRDAGRDPCSIDYINASGLSTTDDDVAETKAIRQVLGDHAEHVVVSSVKGVTGYAISASEMFEVAVCAMAMRNGIVPPTINLHAQDDACDLDYVPNDSRDAKIDTAMSNSFGIDGNYSSIVLEGYDV